MADGQSLSLAQFSQSDWSVAFSQFVDGVEHDLSLEYNPCEFAVDVFASIGTVLLCLAEGAE
jgi:hypothetical protein